MTSCFVCATLNLGRTKSTGTEPNGCIEIDSILKYNNAKRSIPAHPTFVNDNHRDLHL